MPWAGLDDGFHDDPRTLEVGLAGAGLYACASTYIARYLTDGVIPRKAMGRLLEAGDMAPLDALITVGYVREREDGDYELPDYLKANPDRAKVEKRRADMAKRKAKYRAQKDAERAAAARPEGPDDDALDFG